MKVRSILLFQPCCLIKSLLKRLAFQTKSLQVRMIWSILECLKDAVRLF